MFLLFLPFWNNKINSKISQNGQSVNFSSVLFFLFFVSDLPFFLLFTV